MKLFQNKKILIGIAVALVIILGAGFFVMNKNSTSGTPVDEEEQIVVEQMAPEEIGLTITAKADKKAVKFSVEKAQGISSIEYQVIYEADSTAQEKSEGGEARVQRGITGEESLKGASSFESPWLDLGSCSKNVCRYDSGVDSVMLTLKVVKDDGKVYEVEQTLEL